MEDEIADLRDLVNDPGRIKQVIIGELEAVKKSMPSPAGLGSSTKACVETAEPEADVPDYPVHIFLSREGYFKKITPASLRMSSEQKYKEGDGPFLQWEGSNRDELLVFTDRQQCYKAWLSDFDDAKASVLGDYLPTKLGFDEGESPCGRWSPATSPATSSSSSKTARRPGEPSAYQTQTKRKS